MPRSRGSAGQGISRCLYCILLLCLLMGALILPMEDYFMNPIQAFGAALPLADWLLTDAGAEAANTGELVAADGSGEASGTASAQQQQQQPQHPVQPAARPPAPPPQAQSQLQPTSTTTWEPVDPHVWEGTRQVCGKCCNDGYEHAPCFDVHACAVKAPLVPGGRYALILTQLGIPKWPWLTNLGEMQRRADMAAKRLQGTVELVVLIRTSDVLSLGCRHRKLISTHKIRLIEVPWLLPPGMKYSPPGWTMQKFVGWCGPIDLVRLHVLGLEEYNAVAYYDQDVELQGDISPMLRCAASGWLLTTSGGVGDALNIGFIAARPDKRMVLAAQYFAGNETFTRETGWAKAGFAPEPGHFVGAECGQGFVHTLFYKHRNPAVRQALLAAGYEGSLGGTEKVGPASAQIDRCIWNYQTGVDCPPAMNCSTVRVHHKPSGGPAHPHDCSKFEFRKGYVKSEFTMPAPKGPTGTCEIQCVDIGASCQCNSGANSKTIHLSGRIETCQKKVTNPSGDTLDISFNESSVVAMRPSPHPCWCDPSVDVECCVAPPGAEIPQLDKTADSAARTPAVVVEPPAKGGAADVLPAEAFPAHQCAGCCNDGQSVVPCLDAEACAADGPTQGRYALVYTHVGLPGKNWLPFASNVRAQADQLAAKLGGEVDLVLIMVSGDVQRLGCQHRSQLRRHRIKLHEVSWTIPWGMRWRPEGWDPEKVVGWCGPIDLVRLHALGLTNYTAVAFFDSDIELQGDVSPVLRCAATGKFLSTTGGLGTPLNVGFFALKPDKRILEAAERFAITSTFDRETGWANSGFAPHKGYFVGAECGQGFFHTLFYKRESPLVRRSWQAAGLSNSSMVAAQLDGCHWNYQPGFRCARSFSCDQVKAHHKPGGRPSETECSKLEFRPGAHVAALPPVVADEDREKGCSWRCLHVGENCKCTDKDKGTPTKVLQVNSTVRDCTARSVNPSGDVFQVTFEGTTVRVKRPGNYCWCDGELYIDCCIAS